MDVVSDGRSGVTPARSGAPQLEQKRLASALRFPHLVHTRADIDGSSCRGCPAGALDAYGSGENPPPVLEVDGSPKPMRPDCGRVNRRRALTARNVTARTADLVPEQRTLGPAPRVLGCARWRAVALSLLSSRALLPNNFANNFTGDSP